MLTDHHCVLPGYDNVTVRLDFTEEFLASYWLQLMKIAELDYVPKVIIGDHERQGKMLNGFDSIIRSILEVCESRIYLRLTTKFHFTGKELADEEQIQLRTAFMLILLFVSEWVADRKQDEDLRVTLKEPYFQRVYECFNKLFKDIYDGNNENFKSFIFDSNKENSHSAPFPHFASPNRSFNQFNNSLLNITPYDKHKAKRDSLGRFSNTNDSLLKPINLNTTAEDENAADIETLLGTQNTKIMELEKSNIQLLDEKEKLQQKFLKMKNELEELISQKEEQNHNLVNQNHNLVNQNQSLNKSINELQRQCDSVNEELSSVKFEANHLREEKEVLTKELNARMEAAEKLKIKKEALQRTLDDKILELENKEKLYAKVIEEKNILEQDLLQGNRELTSYNDLVVQKEEENQNLIGQLQSINVANGKLQTECDHFVQQLFVVKLEADSLKERNETLIKELGVKIKKAEKLQIDKEALQRTLDDKILELENKEKLYAKVIEEKNILEQDLLQEKRELTSSDDFVIQKEEENQNLLNQNQLLNESISQLQKQYDSLNDEFSNIKFEANQLREQKEGLLKLVNTKTVNEGRLEKELNDLEKVLDAKILELENNTKFYDKMGKEKEILEQDLLKTKRELAASNDFVVQKEEENQNLVGQIQSINDANGKLQTECDHFVQQLFVVKFEADSLKERNETLIKQLDVKIKNAEKLQIDKEALQKTLDDKILELENKEKLYVKVNEEKEILEQDLLQGKRTLTSSDDFVIQKEEENQNLVNQNQSLNESISQLQKQCNSVNQELSNVKLEANHLREEKEVLTKEFNARMEAAEKLKIEKEALQQSFDDKILELENKEKLYAKVIEEKNILEQDLLQEKRNLTSSDDFVIQKEKENQNLVDQNQSLNESINQLQKQCDSVNEELSNVKLEANHLREEKEVLTKELNARMEAAEKFKIEKEELQQSFDDKILELENKDKVCADLSDAKRFLQQDLLKTKHKLEEANNMITEKEVENKNILNEKQSLSGIISKYEMDQGLCKEELANSITEKERLQEENEELSKVVNRKTRNEERLEEDKQALQDALDAEILKFKETKELLSNVQSELLATVNQLRGISVIKSEIEAEFDSFKQFFEEFFASLNAKWAIVRNISDDLVAERLHNISISNELEELKDDLNARERSRTPSLHDEGIIGYSSRRTSFNLPTFHGDENMSELMSEQFGNEIRLDSGLGSNEQTPEITPRTDAVPVVQQSFLRRNASTISHWIIFFFVILLLFTGHIYLCGALIPPWIYIRVHHDQLPPQ
uniref:Uncharacterized protein n=1 Tax=Panagrolaimus davidi TaxID=227884 RepID=A0A914Q2Z3_9BILA